MIVDLSSGAMRRHHVAAGSFVWTSSFSAFGTATVQIVRYIMRQHSLASKMDIGI